MNKTKGLLLTAGIALATAFTFSCSGDDSGGGNTLEEVRIDSQIWSKKNLNIDVPGSKCYNDEPANCDTYGRLYDWETALAVCPDGWHLPSDAEWTVLTDYAGGSSDAGTKLKATSGWANRADGSSGNGTDNFGLSALPGGSGLPDGGFSNAGNYGGWWSSSELSSDFAYILSMYYDGSKYYSDSDVHRHFDSKAGLLSVRCVKD